MSRVLLLCFFSLTFLLTTNSLFAQDGEAQPASDGNLDGLLSKTGNIAGRGALGDGQESIDTFSGILQLQYIDATIPGDAGFDLPIIRTYSSPQYFNDDNTNRVFGRRWDIHFGRIKSNVPASSINRYCATQAYSQLYADDRFNPIFQAADGSSHKIFVANSSDPGASDAITRSRHRVTCNDDGTIKIEDRNGLKYFFDKQDYYRQGNGLQYADIFINDEFLVEYDNYLYVTRIEDPHGNYYEINYSQRFNSDGEFNTNVFTIDSVEGSSGNNATFTYQPSPGSPVASNPGSAGRSPNLVLHSVQAGGRTVNYTFEEARPNTVSLDNNLMNVSMPPGSSTGSTGQNWDYTYHPSVEFIPDSFFLSANSGALESVTSRFGGTTTYEYQFIKSSESELQANIKAVKSKVSDGLGTWTYEFDPGTDGYNRTTVIGPEGITAVYTHCNLSLQASECTGVGGYLVEQKTTGPEAEETVRYQWVNSRRAISPQKISYRLINEINRSYVTDAHVVQLTQMVVIRGDDFLATLYDYDEFDNAVIVVERRTDQYIPRTAFTTSIDISDPDTRASTSEFQNETGEALWLLGLPTSRKLIETNGVVSVPRMEEDQLVKYSYNNRGQVEIENRYGSTTGYLYHDNGDVFRVIDPNGNVTITEEADYVLGVAQVEKHVFSPGEPEQTYLTRIVNKTTGRVESQTVFRDLTTGESYTTLIDFDDLGRVERVTPPTGESTEIKYENNRTITTRGLLVSTDVFDPFGRMVSIISSGPSFNYTATSRYDAYSRLEERTVPYRDGESQYKTTYQYDELGRVLFERNNVDSLFKSYSYDGLTTEVVDRKGQKTTFEYRGFSSFSNAQLISITQEVGGGEPDIVTTIEPTKLGPPLSIVQGGSERKYSYDGRYRVMTMERPESEDVTFIYDENGNVTNRSLGTVVVSYEYDSRNNVTDINYDRSGSAQGFNILSDEYLEDDVSFIYYDDNRIHQASNGQSTWTYQYDGNGNLLTEDLDLLGDINKSFKIEHRYDGNDNQKEIVYPSGKVVPLEPDALGRPTKLGEFLTGIEYESTNIVAFANYGNGKTWEMSQTADKLIQDTVVSGVITETYDYDGNYNVNEVNSSISGLRTYEFDGINRLNRMRVGTDEWESYSYDVNSNITSNAFPEVQDRAIDFTDIEYDLNTQLPIEGFGFNRDGSDKVYGTTISHDIHGNINKFGAYDYLFDGAGYLRGIKQNSVVIAEYDYDANGLRTLINKDDGNIITVYGVNGDLLHEYHVQKQMQSDYVYLNNFLIARYDTERVLPVGEDADQDGLPDELDVDDDNDGQSDIDEAACGSDPLDANDLSVDVDNDGIADCNDDIIDSDFDGVSDVDDLFPNDPTESSDNDLDGIGDYADSDDDNDGQSDADEIQCRSDPFDSDSLATDADGNGRPDCLLSERDQGFIYVWADPSSFGSTDFVSEYFEADLPTDSDFVQVSAATWTLLGLKADGSLVAWGPDFDDIAENLPQGNDFIAIEASRNVAAALRSNGRLELWGDGASDLIPDSVSSGAFNNDPLNSLSFVSVAISESVFSGFGLGLRDDGGITVFGNPRLQEDAPTELGHRAVAAGEAHAVAIKSDGSLVEWGRQGNVSGDLPMGNDFVDIDAGLELSIALRSDGSIVTWGIPANRIQADTPRGKDFIAISAHWLGFLALRRDGTYVTWGEGLSFDKSNGPTASGLVDIDVDLATAMAICSAKTSLDCNDELLDTDFDGTIDNLDVDDDNDGQPDRDELSCGSDPKDISSSALDTDRDGTPDCVDLFPLDSSESKDADGDGIGDNSDTDDDDDGQSDVVEGICGTNPKSSESFARDSDDDGEPDCVDTDTQSLVFEGPIYTFTGFSYQEDPVLDNAPSSDDFVQVEAGLNVSIALKSDGSIVSWGSDAVRFGSNLSPVDELGQPPVGNDFTYLSGLNLHAIALRNDGSLISWGQDTDGQVSNTPAGNNFVTVEAGGNFSVALRADGSLVAWGSDEDGQVSDVPAESNFVAISAGPNHGLALTSDGSLVSWGSNERSLVSGTPSDADFVAIASGDGFKLALKSDGSVVAWGADFRYPVTKSPIDGAFIGIAAGGSSSVAQLADGSLYGLDGLGELLSLDKNFRSVSISSTHVNAIIATNGGTIDTDNDGIPDDVDTDDDNDGVDDALDAFPFDDSESLDTDSDGIGNNADTDDDNDGVEDALDAFPLDASETLDADLDGVGNNADTDDDNDGVDDALDAFPFDDSESLDTDLDGTGNNADSDDDNDGVDDAADAFPLDSSESADSDGDGIGDNVDDVDNNLDTDNDGIPDDVDPDDDNDGVLDTDDAFPLDANESLDTDLDGIGNNADTDNDNDGVINVYEIACESDPLDNSVLPTNTDEDALPDCLDDDDDGDGVLDENDAFPLDSTESVDTDNDGQGDNADSDDDGDGVPDVDDAYPLDPTQTSDNDGDGTGDDTNSGSNNDNVMASICDFSQSSLNDWVSGFNVTYTCTLDADDLPSGSLQAWRIELGYTGGATINSAWMSGYSGSVQLTNENGQYVLSNENAQSQPILLAGDTLTFNLSASGAGHNPDDFSIQSVNLDESVTTDDDGTPAPTEATATIGTINDWGNGFIAMFECALPGNSGQTIDDFLIDLNYTGGGSISNAWMSGYNGGVQVGNVVPDGGYGIRPAGYIPPLTAGDTLSFSVQGQGAGFMATDFDVQCHTGGQL